MWANVELVSLLPYSLQNLETVCLSQHKIILICLIFEQFVPICMKRVAHR